MPLVYSNNKMVALLLMTAVDNNNTVLKISFSSRLLCSSGEKEDAEKKWSPCEKGDSRESGSGECGHWLAGGGRCAI